jgi:hypothetical protein
MRWGALNMSANKDEVMAKMARLEAARQEAEAFVVAGGDLKSKEAVPLGLELVNAFADLATDLGYEIPAPIVQFQFTCECGMQLQVHGERHAGFRVSGDEPVTCPNCEKKHHLLTKPLRLFSREGTTWKSHPLTTS